MNNPGSNVAVQNASHTENRKIRRRRTIAILGNDAMHKQQ
jgi:hypothetical protein